MWWDVSEDSDHLGLERRGQLTHRSKRVALPRQYQLLEFRDPLTPTHGIC